MDRRFCPLALGLGLSLIAPALAVDSRMTRAPSPQDLTRLDQTLVQSQTIPLNPEDPYQLVPAFPKLTFDFPVAMVPVPGSNLLAVLEKDGKGIPRRSPVFIFENRFDVQMSEVRQLVGIEAASSAVLGGGIREDGVLSLAFDPDFAEGKRYLYILRTLRGSLRKRIQVVRFTIKEDLTADSRSEKILIDLHHPNFGHYGGTVIFRPEAYGEYGPHVDKALYISLGDGNGTAGGDPTGNAQNGKSLFGKILRILPQDDGTYISPTDNPRGDWSPEVWAIGLRNPWRMSFDLDRSSYPNGTVLQPRAGEEFAAVSKLWVADVGQEAVEEINVVSKGDNLGWNYFEGTSVFNPEAKIPPRIEFTTPILEYRHAGGIISGRSVTGGVVYRGQSIPQLYGRYVFGDFVSGGIWNIPGNGITPVAHQFSEKMSDLPNVLSFAEDQNQELYAIATDSTPGVLGGESPTGTIYKFIKAPQRPQMPKKISELKIFTHLEGNRPLDMVRGFIPYQVNAILWSDQANKIRWAFIPRTSRAKSDGSHRRTPKINFSERDGWKFPLGSILVKHFEIDTDQKKARRLETRLLVNKENGWRPYTYKWVPPNERGQQPEAYLLEPADSPDQFVDVLEISGSKRVWSYPRRSDCMSCHTQGSGTIIGVRTNQLNGVAPYPVQGRTVNQLWAWRDLFEVLGGGIPPDPFTNARIFGKPGVQYLTYAKLKDYFDSSFSQTDRVRSYLASNCAYCHMGVGPTQMDLDFRWSKTSLWNMGIIPLKNQESKLSLVTPEIPAGARGKILRIAPGDPDRSSLYQRIVSRRDFTAIDPEDPKQLQNLLNQTNSQMPPLGSHQLDPEIKYLFRDWIKGL